MRISKDLREFIEVLNAKGVEYLVVGRTPLLSRAQRAPREGVHHGPKGQSEPRSLGQDKAYPTKPPAFWMWGKLQLAQPGDSPALAFGPTKAMKLGLRGSSIERCLSPGFRVSPYNSTVVSPHPAGVWTRSLRLAPPGASER